jgi:hypothetical protein
VECLYYARAKRRVLGSLLFLVLILFKVEEFPQGLQILQLVLAFIIAMALLVEYKVEINEGYLTYQIQLFNLTVYKKVVHHQNIKRMKFKRIGWAQKCVMIKSEKGFPIKIANFNPNIIYQDLIDFATVYDIPISKTKDYLILER